MATTPGWYPRTKVAYLWLAEADAGDGDLGEHVRGGGGVGGVAGDEGLELGRAERPAERVGRFPDGHVDEGRAAGRTAVQLGGDEPRLLLHEGGVLRPHFRE